MSIDLKVYDNGDHTCLVWLPSDEKPIANCRGFTIHRLLKPAAGQAAQENYIYGFTGFVDHQQVDPTAPWKIPLQRYMWWDYRVTPGNVVQYSIIPVCGPDKDHLSLNTDDASALTPEMTITGQVSAHISAYFNKGIVSAQWVARDIAAQAPAKGKKPPKLADVIADVNNPLRKALSGLLRPQLLALLADVKKNNGEIYAALYELNDPELIPALEALGQKCHLILANGAFNSKKPDENKAVRAQLTGKVDLHSRMVPQGHFAHNKFVVACDSSGNPQRVLSGSTNWTVTGLCTQANNGILVDDPDLGAYFIKEWNLLKDAVNAYPPSLAQANSTSQTFNLDGGTITQWFAPTSAGQDLDFARTLINGAEQGILFLFFNPGVFEPEDQPEMWTLLQNILARGQQSSGLYIRGVVNQEIAGLTNDDTQKTSKQAALDPTNPAPVKLFTGGNTGPTPVPFESMVPKAIKDVFHDWQAELMNTGVHVHSKVIVIDPFGKKPVVITGSHNLGHKASTANDDNMMVVVGDAPLAASYAANIIAIFENYRWNTYVDAHAKDPQVWHGLVDNADWQNSYLDPNSPDLAEIKFWLGEGATAPSAGGGPVPAPAPNSGKVRSTTTTGPSPHRGKGKGKSGKTPPKHRPAKKPPAKTKTKKPATKKPAKKKPAKKHAAKAKPAKKRKQR